MLENAPKTSEELLIWLVRNPNSTDADLKLRVDALPYAEFERLKNCVRIVENAATGDQFERLKNSVTTSLSPFMDLKEQQQWRLAGNHPVMEYCGFNIVPKRDFDESGFYYPEGRVRAGWLCIHHKNGHVMPGAAWAKNVEQACRMIDCYISAEGDSDRFWSLMHLTKK